MFPTFVTLHSTPRPRRLRLSLRPRSPSLMQTRQADVGTLQTSAATDPGCCAELLVWGLGEELPLATQMEVVAEDSEGYFEAYNDVSVHELMIKDRPRMEAYARAVQRAEKDIRGKVVVDVGCGTGILSLLCARAGARKVYAIEASDMAEYAEQIVRQNGLEDVVEVVHARVEDIELPEKADVLISEWMARFPRARRPAPPLPERLRRGWAIRTVLMSSLLAALRAAAGVPPPPRDNARERHPRPRHDAQARRPPAAEARRPCHLAIPFRTPHG